MRIVGAIAPWQTQAVHWWSVRSRRERILLGTLATLAVAAGVIFLLIRPLQATRADALAELRTYDTLQARLLAAGPSPATATARRSGNVAAIVAASAPSFGVVVRGVAVAGGSTRLHIEPVGYEALIHWLADLARTSDVRIDRLAIARAAPPGTVTADLVLSQ